MTPRTLLRIAALNALAMAASLDPADPDYAPLIGLNVFLGQAWPSQSSNPGDPPMPSQALLYIWDENSESVSGNTTALKFQTTAKLVIEGRVETRALAATGTLPATPNQSAIEAAIDGALELLTFAIKKAVCSGVGVAALVLNGNKPVIEGIKEVVVADKLDGMAQRILGNGVVTFDLQFGEYFEPLLSNEFTELVILTNVTAGATANEANTGNGVISAVTVGLGVTPGIYPVEFSNSAVLFDFYGPGVHGPFIGAGTVGAPFSGAKITFTITGVPQRGDGFTVTVSVANETQLNLSA